MRNANTGWIWLIGVIATISLGIVMLVFINQQNINRDEYLYSHCKQLSKTYDPRAITNTSVLACK